MKREGRWNNRAQVTIFIILGIIIVAGAILIYSFYPQIKSTISTQEQNPPSYIQSCIETQMKDAVNKVSLQGGSVSPENYIMYDNNKVEYLCYTNDYGCQIINGISQCCVVQQPMLKQHIELEVKDFISEEVDACFASMKSSYEKQGYDVILKTGEKNVELLPNKINAVFNYSVTLTKGSTQKYDSFTVTLNNDLYELTLMASSMIKYETLYGEVPITNYMYYYPYLKVEQKLSGSGDKVYILTNRDTGDKFEFASKSRVWPPGYATDMTIT